MPDLTEADLNKVRSEISKAFGVSPDNMKIRPNPDDNNALHIIILKNDGTLTSFRAADIMVYHKDSDSWTVDPQSLADMVSRKQYAPPPDPSAQPQEQLDAALRNYNQALKNYSLSSGGKLSMAETFQDSDQHSEIGAIEAYYAKHHGEIAAEIKRLEASQKVIEKGRANAFEILEVNAEQTHLKNVEKDATPRPINFAEVGNSWLARAAEIEKEIKGNHGQLTAKTQEEIHKTLTAMATDTREHHNIGNLIPKDTTNLKAADEPEKSV